MSSAIFHVSVAVHSRPYLFAFFVLPCVKCKFRSVEVRPKVRDDAKKLVTVTLTRRLQAAARNFVRYLVSPKGTYIAAVSSGPSPDL